MDWDYIDKTGQRVFPRGKETYFVQDDEIRRRFQRHPGIQAHRNCLWVWI